MHTICETHAFRRAADQAGMTEEERSELISFLADNPMAGDEIVGTGGCRKLRVAGRGKGKSGGYRTITFFSGNMLPVFLNYGLFKRREG
ncbi:type II toxin-antitoxin system RelE/ParE family toxin [uncultured Pleomorphomonas sp.]|uniref:type II toxin-antitoxin system RelE/ParE family toxin n=1 Tax=uncultured Pleomorphomonas sp. TaxID=442121 RepID=UPI00338E2713